jgi:hypothetical protein
LSYPWIALFAVGGDISNVFVDPTECHTLLLDNYDKTYYMHLWQHHHYSFCLPALPLSHSPLHCRVLCGIIPGFVWKYCKGVFITTVSETGLVFLCLIIVTTIKNPHPLQSFQEDNAKHNHDALVMLSYSSKSMFSIWSTCKFLLTKLDGYKEY